MPTRSKRFAHMTPLLWWMFAVMIVLALAVMVLGIQGMLNARDGGVSPLFAPAAGMMTTVMALFTVLAQRRRKDLGDKT